VPLSAADMPFASNAARPAAVAYTVGDLCRLTFPARRTILMRDGQVVLREGHLWEIHAERGLGKTWLSTTLGLVAASGTEALGFSAPHASRVAHIEGEMAGEDNQSRIRLLCDHLHVNPDLVTMTILAADWQDDYLPRLDTPEGQRYVEPVVADADLVILDNRSCLFDPEGEKDPTAWQPAQDYLLSLRRRGKAVIVVHHSNRLGGARGHSKAEDPLDAIINLTRPEDYRPDHGARFVVTFTKSRGVYGAAVAPFEAALTPDGWQVQGIDTTSTRNVVDKLLAHIQLSASAGERSKSASAAIAAVRVNKAAGLKAWAEMLDRGLIRKHPDGGFCVA
jgi:putative DNA primase/helicase